MSKNKGCRIKVKGGARCGEPLVLGKKYCQKHSPPKTPPKITTYSIGENTFRGEKKVKTSEYSAYLQSEAWKEKAASAKANNPNCSLCNRRGILNVHHRTYVRCGKEEPLDLIVLCNDCHELFHQFYKYDGRVGHFVKK